MSEAFQALRKGDRWDFIYEKNPRCPHCGHVADLSDNEWWHICNEGEHDVECPSCDREYLVSTHVEFTFSTDEQEDDL